MDFAIKFYRGCRILDKANEIIIKYDKKNTNLFSFVQEKESTQRIIVNITELEDIDDNLEIFKEAFNLHNNFAILLSLYQDYSKIIELNIPFFFIEGVNDYDDLKAQIKLGVSDVYIINEMGFNLPKISQYCHNNNVKIRVFPNVAQTSSKLYVDTFHQFFIRPDDISLYADIVDICEFFGTLEAQDTLYSVYNDERWLGELNEVILGLDKNIDNKTIMPFFGLKRLDCKKRCNFEKCDICGAAESFGKVLKEKGLGLYKKRSIKIKNDSASSIDN